LIENHKKIRKCSKPNLKKIKINNNEKNENYFGIPDVDVLADLGGDGGTELGDRSDVV